MMIDEKKMEILDSTKKDLMAAGFDNVVILANEGGSHGAIGIACAARPALMRLLMASYFMDETMDRMVEEDSTAMTLWKHLLKSTLETIAPRFRSRKKSSGTETGFLKSYPSGKARTKEPRPWQKVTGLSYIER